MNCRHLAAHPGPSASTIICFIYHNGFAVTVDSLEVSQPVGCVKSTKLSSVHNIPTLNSCEIYTCSWENFKIYAYAYCTVPSIFCSAFANT